MKDNIYWFGPDDDWGELYKTEEGRFLPDNMYADYIREKEEQKQRVESLINVQKWTRTDFDTLNTLINEYKITNDELLFNDIYEKYLKRLINGCTKKYLIKIPNNIKTRYFADTNELTDVAYELLIKTIKKWEYNRIIDGKVKTLDFAAFYIRKVKMYRDSLIKRFNKFHKKVSIITINFGDENMEKLAQKYYKLNNKDFVKTIEFDDFLTNFIKLLDNDYKIVFICMLAKFDVNSNYYNLSNKSLAQIINVSERTVIRMKERLIQQWKEYSKAVS